MFENDPTKYPYWTYGAVLLVAMWGGIVSFLTKRKEGTTRPFNFTEFIGELTTSGFAGMMAYQGCLYFKVDPLLAPLIIGIAGHMGSRFIYKLEQFADKLAEKRFGIKLAEEESKIILPNTPTKTEEK